MKPFTREQVCDYLASNPEKAHLRNIELICGGHIELIGAKKRPMVRIRHDPESKVRVVILLSEPILLAILGQDGYRALYKRIGELLFGPGVYDDSCKNPSRIMWLPAKKPGSLVEHRSLFIPGPLLIIDDHRRAVERDLEKPRQRKAAQTESYVRNRKSRGATVIDEIAQCLELIPASVSYGQWFKVLAAIHHETEGSEEGLNLAHDWSATASELYDPDKLDTIWDGFYDSDKKGPKAGMGSLIYMARQTQPSFSPRKAAAPDFDTDMIGE